MSALILFSNGMLGCFIGWGIGGLILKIKRRGKVKA